MELNFNHSKSFRYELLRTSPNAKTVLYALHGYGQLAKFFARKFQELPDDIIIVAPEGMHRFYLKEFSGRVGASWMTKEARELDITDNISWLDALDNQISNNYSIEKRILLGFSQGGATAARWAAKSKIHFDELILWSCVFPPDLEYSEIPNSMQKKYFALGTEDEFYTSDDQEKLIQFYSDRGFKTFQFNGKHDIHIETLSEIFRQMN